MWIGVSVVFLDELMVVLGVKEMVYVVNLICLFRDRGVVVICISYDIGFVFDIVDWV